MHPSARARSGMSPWGRGVLHPWFAPHGGPALPPQQCWSTLRAGGVIALQSPAGTQPTPWLPIDPQEPSWWMDARAPAWHHSSHGMGHRSHWWPPSTELVRTDHGEASGSCAKGSVGQLSAPQGPQYEVYASGSFRLGSASTGPGAFWWQKRLLDSQLRFW